MSNENSSVNDLADMFSEETGAAGLLGNEEELSNKYLSPEDIIPDPDQPRKRNKDVKYISDELETEKGREKGIRKAITVTPLDNGRYMIVDGESRWLAAKLANLPTVPVKIEYYSDTEEGKSERLLDQLKDNQQRKPMDPRDEGAAFIRLQEQGKSIQEIADENYEATPQGVFKMTRDKVTYRINIAKSELSEETRFISELYDEPDEDSIHTKRYSDLKLLSSLYGAADKNDPKKVKALAIYLIKQDKLDRKSVAKLKKLDYSKTIKDLKRDLMADPEKEAVKESVATEQQSVDRQSEGVSDSPEIEREEGDADMSASEELPQSEDDVSSIKTSVSGKSQETKSENNTEVVLIHVSVEGVNYLLLADQPARKKGHVVLCEPASGAVDEFPLKDVKVTKLELSDESR